MNQPGKIYKSSKVVEPTNKKALGTSVIISPMSPPSLGKKKLGRICKDEFVIFT